MNITIIGFGTMGRSLARTIKKNAPKHKLSVIERNNKINKPIAADVILIAVKPQDLERLSAQLQNKVNDNAVIISIAAGVTIKKLVRLFGHKNVIRAMPNLGLSVGQGIMGWKSANIPPAQKVKIKRLLNQICENFEVPKEFQLDAITAISASGLAYFFLLAENLRKAAISLNFSSAVARRLVVSTFSAAAELQKLDNYEPLLRKVASKGGTTEAALDIFRKEKFSKTVSSAVKAAERRSKELSHD
jgi:pyrroline-5-carboxylate reductase